MSSDQGPKHSLCAKRSGLCAPELARWAQMRLFSKTGRTKSTHHNSFFPDAQHPGRRAPPSVLIRPPRPALIVSDLPLSPQHQAPSPRPQQNLSRSTSVSERFSAGYAGGMSSSTSRDRTATKSARQTDVPSLHSPAPTRDWVSPRQLRPTPIQDRRRRHRSYRGVYWVGRRRCCGKREEAGQPTHRRPSGRPTLRTFRHPASRTISTAKKRP